MERPRLFFLQWERFLVPVAAILLTFPALWQFLTAGYFDAHDSLLHLYRMVEFDVALRNGDFYPRWFPDFALGYGYPLLNYYPPLTYYAAEAIHALGLGFADALKAVVVIGLAASGVGMYLFAKEILGSRPAALLSSVAFVYFPYHLTDAYVRGAIPEVTLIAFMPFALWAFHRLVLLGKPGYAIAGVLLVSGLILTHVMFVFFLPILAVYIFAVAWTQTTMTRQRALLFGTCTFALGVALASFYWLPVLLEKQDVAVVAADWMVEDLIKGELLAPEALLQMSPAYDYEDKFPPELAALDLALAVAGLGVWLWGRNRRRLLPVLAVFLVATPVFIFLLSEPSFPFWRHTPLVGLIQFPWRLLAILGLCTSLLAGLLCRSGRLSYPLAALACLAIILAGTWQLKLNHRQDELRPLSVATSIQYEYDSGVMGTAYANEWLPATARRNFTSPRFEVLPPPESDSSTDVVVSSFRRTGPLSYSASVSAEKTTQLRFHTFFFPGWQAQVDGSPTMTYPTTALGLTTFDVPEGEHEVAISFGDTLPRAAGRMVSLAALAALSPLCLLALRRRHDETTAADDWRIPSPFAKGERNASSPIMLDQAGSYAPLRWSPFTILSSLPIVLAGLIVIFPHLSVAPAPIMESKVVDFAGQLRLLAFEADSRPLAREGRIDVTLYWQSLQAGGSDLDMLLEAFDRQGNLVGVQRGAPIYDTARTSMWSKNEIVRDRREVGVLEGVPPGPVSFRLSVWSGGKSLGFTELLPVD